MSTIKEQIAALEKRLETIATHRGSAEQLLSDRLPEQVLHPDDARLSEDVEKLEKEITGYDRERARVLGAIGALKQRNAVADRTRIVAELRRSQADTKTHGAKMRKTAGKILDLVAELGPLLAELDALGATRSANARAVLAAGQQRANLNGTNYGEIVTMKRGAFPAALAAALWRAGLTRVGPDMVGFLELRPPRTDDNRWLREDLHTVLEAGLDREDATVECVMQRALDHFDSVPA